LRPINWLLGVNIIKVLPWGTLSALVPDLVASEEQIAMGEEH